MFDPKLYSRKYYNRHLTQYREWENAIGKHIFTTLKPTSILDLGCGVGSYIEGALNAGCQTVMGIEISFDVAKEFFTNDISPFIRYGDATKQIDIDQTFDCVMSFETGEHIDPNGTQAFIDNIVRFSNKYIVMTVASPGQGGTGHINLRPKDFWISAIESKGFKHKQELVNQFVSDWKHLGAEKYILRNLMVFERIIT